MKSREELIFSFLGLASLLISILLSFYLISIMAVGHGIFYSINPVLQILILSCQILAFYFGIIVSFRKIGSPVYPRTEPKKYVAIILLVVVTWMFLSMFCEMYPLIMFLLSIPNINAIFPMAPMVFLGFWFLIPIYFLLRFSIVKKIPEEGKNGKYLDNTNNIH